MATASPQGWAPAQGWRALYMAQVRQWHWISSAVCLVGLILFSVTGVTLNHANWIKAEPKVTQRTAKAPPEVLRALAGKAEGAADPLPPPVRAWLDRTLDIETPKSPAEWSADEVYLAMPRPGGDAWVRIGLSDGATEYERTVRGTVSLLNDLHKGRNTGPAWRLFIDVFAGASVLFGVTGLLLLQSYARTRPITWPLVAAGVAGPLILILLFVHL